MSERAVKAAKPWAGTCVLRTVSKSPGSEPCESAFRSAAPRRR